jgi:hypothetical protein
MITQLSPVELVHDHTTLSCGACEWQYDCLLWSLCMIIRLSPVELVLDHTTVSPLELVHDPAALSTGG